MADGTVTIDVDIPTGKVKSDVQAINEEVNRIGNHAGDKLDQNLNKNLDKAKSKAKQTGQDIDKDLGKDHKTKVTVDADEAKRKAKEVKNDLDKVPKEHKTKYTADDSDAKRKADEAKKKSGQVPKEHKTKFDADNSDANKKAEETKRKTNEVPKKHNTDFNATDHTEGVFARIKSHFDKVNEQGKETHSIFKSVFSANIISNAAMSAFGAVRGALGGMIGEAKQYALEQQTMNATWLTLTNSASKGKAMVNQINSMAAAAQNSTHMVDQLSQKFYAINNNAKQTGQLTKAVLTLQDAFGQSDAAVENFGTQFAQMMANGKVSAQDMMSIVNTFPKLKPMLLDYERQVHHSKNMTMSEMSDLMSKGKIKSQDMINVVLQASKKFKNATNNFTNTIPGMKRTVEAQMPRLLQAFEGPLTKMQSPVYGAVAKWVSSKKTENEFGKLGKTVSSGMNNVMKAFGGTKSVSVTQALDNAINGINKGLKGVFGWISGHAKDLKTIALSIASIGGQIAKSVWADFASIIRTIGNMFGITSKNAKSSSSAIHVIAEALNGLAKNKAAIKAISDAIVAITVVKGLNKVGGSLFAIGEKGYGAWKKLKALRAGMKGLDLAENATKGEKAWAHAGRIITKAFRGIRKGFSGLISGFKYLGKGIAYASKELGGKFVQQFKLVGKGVKGLGKGIWNAAKAIGREAASAGRFLGGQLAKGFKASAKFAKSLGLKIWSLAKSVGSKALSVGKTIGRKISAGIKATTKFSMGQRLAVGAVSGAAVATPEVINAVKDRHNADKRSQDIGGAVGALAGGTLTSMIPVVGPMLAPVGAIIGKYAGRWGGQAVNNFTKGWQRNKPPKRFWSLENLGYSAHNMWKGFTQGVSNTVKWFKKNWKEVGLYFVSPLAGAINSLYKHNKGFRKWVNGLVKGFKSVWKGVGKWFSNIGKGIQKSWRGMTKWFSKLGSNMAKGLKKSWHSMTKWFSNIGKGIRKGWKSMTSFFSRLGSAMSKGLKKTWHSIAKWFGSVAKGVRNAWHNMTAWFSRLGRSAANGLKSAWRAIARWFGSLYRGVTNAWHGLTSWFSKLSSNAVKGFKSAWHGLTSWFQGIIDGIKSAWDGFWDKVSGPIKFLGKVFSGKAEIGGIHFASGTDWRKRWGTPAILNDGTDSPATNNRESVIHANGAWELLPNIPFLKRWLLPNDEVINAKDTAKIVSSFGNAVHFASGSVSVSDSPFYGIKTAVDRIYKVATDSETLAKAEVIRKRKRDAEADRRHKKNDKDKSAKDKKSSKHKPLKITIDNKKHKGDVLIDKGLLTGVRKETGKETWINEKLFNRLMSYTKAKPVKVSKNSRIRYRELPAKRVGKNYLVDSHWLTGGRSNTGKLEEITREDFLKLLQFTKQERKYKLPKKKRKKTKRRRERTTRRRESTSSSRRTSRRSYSSERGYSTGSRSISSGLASVAARVSGLSSVTSLAKAIKSVTGTHKSTIKVSYSGTYKAKKSIDRLIKSVGKLRRVKSPHLKVKYSGTFKAKKSFDRLTKSIKSTSKRFKLLRSASRSASSAVKTLGSHSSTLRKRISSLYKEAKKSRFGSAIKKQAEEAVKSLEGKGNFAKTFKKLADSTKKTLEKMHSEAKKEFSSMWSALKKESSGSESKIEHDLSAFESKFKRQFHSIDNGVQSIFSKFWRSMRTTARNGLDGVIDVLNQAIGRIDNVIGQFGGSKSAVHKVARLATGTGALEGVRRPIVAPTLAILNDGDDSPETGNKEAIWDRNTGNVEVVPGRFTPRILRPGQEVFNATETKMLGYTSPQYFASGTGALKQLYEIAKHNWQKPAQTGQALFSSINGLTGAINQLAQGARSKAETQGVKWWSQLWKMVDDKVNDGDLGPASGLLKAVEQMGEGAIYSQAKRMAKGFYDCSSLVSRALKKYYHADWATPNGWALTVGTLWPHAHRIPKSEARPGDPVFWLPDGHVGIYAGHNRYYSAFGPTGAKNSVGMHPLSWGVTGVSPTFARFNGLNTEGGKAKDVKVKADNKLQKQIRSQVGKGFWSTIQKIADKYGEHDDGDIAGKPSGDHAHWLKEAHIPKSWWNDISWIINKESDWRATAKNPTSTAYGIGQLEDYSDYRKHGGDWKTNPIAQLMGMRDYIRGRYGNAANAKRFWEAHNWYARGGIVTSPQTAVVGEGNAPESIIPWDQAYRGRAYQIMQATLDQFKAQDGKSQLFQNQAQQAVDLTKTNAEIEAINEKFDQALATLGILTSQNDVIQVNNYLDKNKIGEAMFSVMKRLNMRSTRNTRYNISGH